MGLYTIDIEKLNSQIVNDTTIMHNHASISRLIISKIIKGINIYYNDCGSPTNVYIGLELVDYLFSQPIVTPSPTHMIDVNKNDASVIIGKLMGTNVYVTTLLDEFEYFVGDEKDIQILKRQDKINKILQNGTGKV